MGDLAYSDVVAADVYFHKLAEKASQTG